MRWRWQAVARAAALLLLGGLLLWTRAHFLQDRVDAARATAVSDPLRDRADPRNTNTLNGVQPFDGQPEPEKEIAVNEIHQSKGKLAHDVSSAKSPTSARTNFVVHESPATHEVISQAEGLPVHASPGLTSTEPGAVTQQALQAVEPPQLKPVGIFPKSWWAAGLNARSVPQTLHSMAADDALVLRWSSNASLAVARFWANVQHVHPEDNLPVSLTCNLTTTDSFLELPCADWGLLSMMRDIETLFLEAVLRSRTVVQRPDLAGVCKVYCQPSEAEGRDTHLGCFFERFSGCRSPYGPGSPSALDSDPHNGIPTWNNGVPPLQWWDNWLQSGDVWWETRDGVRSERRGDPEHAVVSEARLSMTRSIVAPILYRPASMVTSALATLEKNVADYVSRGAAGSISSSALGGLPQPMLVIHARRTDKNNDYGGSLNVRDRFPDKQLPLSMYGRMARAVEDAAGVRFRSVFLISDDILLWRNRSDIISHLTDPKDVTVIVNPYWLQIKAVFDNPAWKHWGHNILGNLNPSDVGASTFTFHTHLLADILFAGKHGDYLVGCGSSGVSQMIAQLMGSRLRLDPAWRSLWEEDFVLSAAAGNSTG